MGWSGIWYTVLIAAFVVLVLYQILWVMRRPPKRERVNPRRLILKICVFLGSGIALFASLISNFEMIELAEVPVGLLIGVAVALFNVGQTEFGTDADGPYHVPNDSLRVEMHVAIATAALFVGRIIYRFLHDSATRSSGSGNAATDQPAQSFFQNAYDPVLGTLAFIALSYYIVYQSIVLFRSWSR